MKEISFDIIRIERHLMVQNSDEMYDFELTCFIFVWYFPIVRFLKKHLVTGLASHFWNILYIFHIIYSQSRARNVAAKMHALRPGRFLVEKATDLFPSLSLSFSFSQRKYFFDDDNDSKIFIRNNLAFISPRSTRKTVRWNEDFK